MYEHKHHFAQGFTTRYHIDKLVYFEAFEDVHDAIAREKQLKSGSRRKKVKIIEENNSSYKDLYNSLL